MSDKSTCEECGEVLNRSNPRYEAGYDVCRPCHKGLEQAGWDYLTGGGSISKDAVINSSDWWD